MYRLLLALVTLLTAVPSQIPRTGDPTTRGLAETAFPRIQKLAEGVYSYEQLRSAGSERFTTVSLFVVTSDGVLVADGQGSIEETRRMIGEIRTVTSQPITHLVIGSDHGDHTAGNAAFPSSVKVFAHPVSKTILEKGSTGVPSPPITAVEDRLVLTLGTTEIQILFLGRAHTGGDLSVYLPKEKILFMSEAFLNRIFPAMRSAYPSEWVATLARAQTMDVTTYVPGHGFVESPAILKEELETARNALATVIAEARRLHAAGVPVEAAVTQARFGDLESWTLRSSQAATAIRRVYLELDGQLSGAARTQSSATSVQERQAAWAAHQQLAASSPFARLPWRALGPTQQSSRIEAIAVPVGQPSTMYVGPASGNVWKTTNAGLTWQPVFEKESAFAAGDIAVAPSNPDIVWVGTGEVQPRHSGYAYAGTGVFKSVDAGRTWTHMGLADTHHIGKVLIDPVNPDVVYVAAMGHQWTPNTERGVFKTTDGGRTWTRVLFVDDRTGAIDVVVDPSNRNLLFASLWQIETGPASGIYRSADAGRTWTKLGGGLPTGLIGRSNIDIASSRPETVYVYLDNRAPAPGSPAGRPFVGGEVYRSDDRGLTWRKANTEDIYPVFGVFGWKFCDIRVSPDNPDEVYIFGNRAFRSVDGGRTYARLGESIRRLRDTQGLVMHLDHHEFWINPADPNHLLLGNDGGVFASHDRGHTWLHLNTMPIGQFYSVSVDMAEPYNIYGGTQDNAAMYGPSTYTVDDRRNENEPWKHVYLDQWTGGDSYVTLADPADRRYIYYSHQNGDLRRMDTAGPSIQTGSPASQRIAPRAPRGEAAWRIGWYMPYLISSFDPATLYAGTNKLVKSTDRGVTWTAISPDLSDPAGGDRAVVPTGTITMISESPIQRGLLYAGTESGRVHLTRDDGASWTDVSRGLPNKWVSRVIASQYAAGTVYVSQTGYRENDVRAYLFRSTDFGASWTSLVGNLPAESINVVREDPRNPNVLYVGTDAGVYASLDRGASWVSLSATLPTTPVHDLVVHPRDDEIVIGTHGRGVFVLDARPIQQWQAAGSDPKVFPPHPALVRIADEMEPAGTPGSATITFSLGADGPATLTIRAAGGAIVRTLQVQGVRGLNVVTWDLIVDGPAAQRPRPAAPGDYVVTLTTGGRSAEAPLRLTRFVRWTR